MKELIFSTPRTGSVLAYIILSAYLSCKDGTRFYRGELFNHYHYNLYHRNVPVDGGEGYQTINLHHKERPDDFRKVPFLTDEGWIGYREDTGTSSLDLEAESIRRIELLRDASADYCLHVHASPISPCVFDYLRENYVLICTERRDVLEQLLSYAIAQHTRMWAVRSMVGYPKIALRSLTMGRAMFEGLVARIRDYRTKIAQTENKRVLVYEDFANLAEPFEVLDMMGHSDWRNVLDPADYRRWLTKKIEIPSKHDLFTNIDEVRGWLVKEGFG